MGYSLKGEAHSKSRIRRLSRKAKPRSRTKTSCWTPRYECMWSSRITCWPTAKTTWPHSCRPVSCRRLLLKRGLSLWISRQSVNRGRTRSGQRSIESQDGFRGQSGGVPPALRRRSQRRRSAGHMDRAIYYQYEAHDHRGSDARNHLHVPRVRSLGVHELE